MVGWLLLLAVLAAATTDVNLLPSGVPLEVGSGVSIRPGSGWREVAEQEQDGLLVMQKGETRLSIEVGSFPGGNRQLLDLMLQRIAQEADVFRPLAAHPLTMGGDPDGLASVFSAVRGNVQLDGEVAVIVHSGLGVVATSVASAGTLPDTQAEIRQMLSGMELPQ